MFTIIQLIYFILSTFLFPHIFNFDNCLRCSRIKFLCDFLFLIWLSLQLLHLIIGLFRILGLPYLEVESGLDICAMFISPCKNSRAVVLMLHKMAFYLSGKMVALHLGNGTAKVYLCSQGGYSISFSFQTSLPHFESGQQAWYYSYSGIHTYPSQCGSPLSILGEIGFIVGWKLLGFPKVLNMLEDVHHQCLIKNIIMDVLVDWEIQGLPSLSLTLWQVRDVCFVGKGAFFLSL